MNNAKRTQAPKTSRIGKWSLLAVVLALLLSSFAAGCQGGNETTGSTSKATAYPSFSVDGRDYPPIEVSVFRQTDMSQNYSDVLFVDYVKAIFNITLKYEYIPSTVMTEKMNLSFATNTYKDVLELVDSATVNRLAKDDFFIPLSDHLDKLDNYRNAYSDYDWNNLVDTLSDENGKFYILPVKEAENSSSSYVWMYRKDAFDAIGADLPVTTDDLYNALSKIKQSLNPNLTMPNRWGLYNALEGYNLAFRTKHEVWKDVDEDGTIVYGAVTDKFRDLLIYMNKLYAAGILTPEYVTMTDQQRMAQFSQGNVYANFQFSGYEEMLNKISAAAKIDAVWVKDKEHLTLTAYPELGPMQQKWPAFYAYGVALTDRVEEDRLDQLLDYVNWSCSEEGQLFHEFGVDGITYEVTDQVPRYIGPYLDETDPNSYFGLIQDHGPFGFYLIQNEAHAALAYPEPAKTNKDLEGVDIMDYSAIPYRFTKEENDQQADLATVLDQYRDEYIQAFIAGTKNPAKDADWQEFLDKMNSAGLETYLKILRDAHARIG